MSIKVKSHPSEQPRGKRDPRKCMVQAGGTLRYIFNGEPRMWTNRPAKFPGHIRKMASKGHSISGIMWKQLGSSTWWRIPEWPDGEYRG